MFPIFLVIQGNVRIIHCILHHMSHGIQEVSGSIPLISTKTPRTQGFSVFFFYFPNFLARFHDWDTLARPLEFFWNLKHSRGAIMARITMRKTQETKLSEIFTLYLASAAARGVKDKTLRTYEQHFNAISKRLDVEINISLITSKHLDKMILRMREDGLSDSSINSFTRTLKVFFSWCNEQG